MIIIEKKEVKENDKYKKLQRIYGVVTNKRIILVEDDSEHYVAFEDGEFYCRIITEEMEVQDILDSDEYIEQILNNDEDYLN